MPAALSACGGAGGANRTCPATRHRARVGRPATRLWWAGRRRLPEARRNSGSEDLSGWRLDRAKLGEDVAYANEGETA